MTINVQLELGSDGKMTQSYSVTEDRTVTSTCTRGPNH